MIPASTEINLWFEYCWNAGYVLFLRGRLNFEINGVKAKNSQTKGSALIIFSKKAIPGIDRLEEIGKLITQKSFKLEPQEDRIKFRELISA